MDERIYCPKCEGTEHKKNHFHLQDTPFVVSVVRLLMGISVVRIFGVLFVRRRDTSHEEEFVPESYFCKNCNHYFLSSDTYAGEIAGLKKFRKQSIGLGFLHLVFAAIPAGLLLVAFLSDVPVTGIGYAYGFLIFLLLCTFFCFCSAFSCNRMIKKSTANWKEFLDAQAKHTKTVNSSAGQRIPAWKRVQLEQQGQNSL